MSDRHDLTRESLTPRILAYLAEHSDATSYEVADALMNGGATPAEWWQIVGAMEALVRTGKLGQTSDKRATREHRFWLIVAQGMLML